MKKRWMSLLLCLALCVSLCPVAALADETQEPAEEIEQLEQLEEPSEPTPEPEPTAEPTETPTEETSEESESESESESVDEAVAAVEASIDALPELSALEATDADGRDAVYAAAQNAADAFEFLTDEQQEQLANLDRLIALMDWFNTQTETTDTTETPAITEIGSLTDLTEAINGTIAQQKDNLKLTDNITLTADLVIGRSVTIDLNNHNINLDGHHIEVSDNATVTLKDNDATGTQYWSVGSNGQWNLSSSGTYTTTGGCIYGGCGTSYNDKQSGGAVLVDSGTFKMEGGNIVGSKTADGTYKYRGGGVYVNQNGKFKMEGGSIVGNVGVGGGVYVANSGAFTMTGGTISHNTATTDGGGVYVYGGGTFTMTDGSISGNTGTNGGGVHVNQNGTFKMEGGEISGNVANGGTGGGVKLCGKGTFIISGSPIIKDNTKNTTKNDTTTSTTSNVHLDSTPYITVSGALSEGASIGVTTQSKPSKGNPVTIAKGADATDTTGGYSLQDSDKEKFFLDVETKEYGIELKDNTLQAAVPHTHSWSYTVSSDGKTITATCKDTSCTSASGGSVTVAAPSDLTYDGSAKAATVSGSFTNGKEKPSISYSVKGGDALTSAPTNAGTYTASITVEDQTASVEYTIAKAQPTASDFTFTEPSDLTYSNSAKEATVTSAKNGMGGVTVKYYEGSNAVSDAKDAGTYTVKIDVAEGTNYNSASELTDSAWKFTISRATASATATPTGKTDLTYNGTEQELVTAGSTGDGKMQYKLGNGEWSNSIPTAKDAGTYTVSYKVVGDGNHNDSGEGSVSVTIQPKTLTNADLEYTGKVSKEYDGNTNCTVTSVSVKAESMCANETPLTINGTAKYNSANVAEANKVTFTPNAITSGNYTLEATETLEIDASITPKSVEPTVTVATGSTYSGSPLTPAVTVTADGKTLKQGTDYNVSYSDNIAASENTAGVTVTAVTGSNYTWAAETEYFTIAQADPAAPTGLTGCKGNKLSTVKLPAGWSWVDGDATTLSTDTSTYTANYAGDSNHNSASDVSVTVTVSEKTTQSLAVSMSGWTYGNTASKPSYTTEDGAGTVTVKYTGRGNTSYTESEAAPTDAGNYTVSVSYETETEIWSGTADFTIAAKPITDAVVALDQDGVTYDGTEKTRTVKSVTLDGTPLTDADYTVTGGTTGTTAGRYTVTVTGRGNYSDTATGTWTINRARPSITGATATVTYGKAVTDVSITANTNGVEGRFEWRETNYGDVGTHMLSADFVPTDTKNYNTQYSAPVVVTVSQADAPTLPEVPVTRRWADTGEQSVSLAGVMNAAAKVESYTLGPVPEGVTASMDGGTLKLKITGMTEAKVGDTFTIPVTIASKNYKEATVSVVVTLTAKEVPTIKLDDTLTKPYDGKPAGLPTENPTVDGKPIDGTWRWERVKPEGGAAPLSLDGAGAGEDAPVGVKDSTGENVCWYLVFEPTDTTNYEAIRKLVQVTITPKAVTITSADVRRDYNGTALANGDAQVKVDGAVDGETFDVSFTGSQTNIGSSANSFELAATGTAELSNYTVTIVPGTLRVAVPESTGDAVEKFTKANVTADNSQTIAQTLQTVNEYLAMEPTADEREALETLKNELEAMTAQLEKAEDARTDDVIGSVEKIDTSNVKAEDKTRLTEAKAAIEKALEDFGGNYTKAEKKELAEKLEQIESALKALEKTEKAEQRAEKRSARTGDESMPLVYLVVALMALAAIVGIAAARKKQK